MSQDAMDLGIPIPTVDAAVAARELSGWKDLRVEAEALYKPQIGKVSKADVDSFLESALHMGMLVSYSQGFSQLHAANEEYKYGTDLQTVAKIWRAGCIIRSKLLEPSRAAFARNPELQSLLLDPEAAVVANAEQRALRSLVSAMTAARIPCPAYSACLNFFDGFLSSRLPANLIQGQRDLFGAHTYERLDKPGTFHTLWNS